MYGEPQTHAAGWTDERVAELRRLWATGDSAAQIAAALGGGVTRNAVLGKAMRLKLPQRPTVSRRYPAAARQATLVPALAKVTRGADNPLGSHKIRQGISARPVPVHVDDETDIGIDVSKRVGLLDLTNHTCRWPVGTDTGARQMFCGCYADLIASGPYCPHHTVKAEAHR